MIACTAETIAGSNRDITVLAIGLRDWGHYRFHP
jgi:hypothetical protein